VYSEFAKYFLVAISALCNAFPGKSPRNKQAINTAKYADGIKPNGWLCVIAEDLAATSAISSNLS